MPYLSAHKQISEQQAHWEKVLRGCDLSMSRGKPHQLIYVASLSKVEHKRTAKEGMNFFVTTAVRPSRPIGEGAYSCRKCGKVKPASAFSKKRNNRLRETCRACDNRLRAERRRNAKSQSLPPASSSRGLTAGAPFIGVGSTGGKISVTPTTTTKETPIHDY